MLELQLRRSATVLYGSYRYFTYPMDPWILQQKLELQLVGDKVIGTRIYKAQMPAFVGKELKQFNLFYATHMSLSYLGFHQ
jgi:hypothetical protein